VGAVDPLTALGPKVNTRLHLNGHPMPEE